MGRTNKDWRTLPTLPDDYWLYSDFYVVRAGWHEGRICWNDDNIFVLRSELDDHEFDMYAAADLQFYRYSEVDTAACDDYDGSLPDDNESWGLPCEVVLFRDDLLGGSYIVPRDWLEKPTVQDLLHRKNDIYREIFQLEKTGINDPGNLKLIIDLLYETQLVGGAVLQLT